MVVIDARAAHHEWDSEKARRGHHDSALKLPLRQRLVDDAAGVVCQARQDMREAQIVLQRQRWRQAQLLGAEQAEKVVGIELPALVMDLAVFEHADAEIELSRCPARSRDARGSRSGAATTRPGRSDLQALDKRWE